MTHGRRRRGAPAVASRFGILAGVVAVGVFAVAAAAASGGQAPRRPPEPFAVFVEASGRDDDARQARVREALAEVRDRVGRRRDWFRLVESREAADLTLRITNYRITQTMRPKIGQVVLNGRVELVERSEVVESHYVDALALAGEVRGGLTGLDERDSGARLSNAANHLAEELERFCKDNYAALSAARG